MQRFVIPFSLSAAAMLGSIQPAPAAELDATRPLQAVPFQDVTIDSPFWNPRLEAHAQSTVEANLYQCEITGRIQNFAVAAGKAEGKHQGFLFNDSDVYKSIEAASYSLMLHPDPELTRYLDDLIAKIAEIDARDGVADGKLTYKPLLCTTCRRPIFARQQRCLYCGAPRPVDSVFKTV